MFWNRVSVGAVRCCKKLWDAGFQAFPVGGCVRDLLLDRVPGDWDITTNARPEQVMKLFNRVIPTGVKHGTVTVIFGKEHIEVTTFRGESGYSDGRHPDRVRFDATLEEDLSRRDFTINAMALNRDGTVTDLFGGQADLEQKSIRCVGDPVCRFGEDGLRMFRAVRFGAQLGFELTEETTQAIQHCACGASQVAAERIRAELEKTLCAPQTQLVRAFFALGLMEGCVNALPGETEVLQTLPPQQLLRWAGLCALLLQSGGIESAESFLRGLRLEGSLVRACKAGEHLWHSGLPQDEEGWRFALAQCGTDGCRAGAAMGDVCEVSGYLNHLEYVIAQDPCVRVEQLALSGCELASRGLKGTQIGAAQRYLLSHVLAYPQENRAELLRLKLEEFLACN